MKRGPIIALVVLLLVAAVVVTGLGSWEKLWVEWAYNREIASETWDGRGQPLPTSAVQWGLRLTRSSLMCSLMRPLMRLASRSRPDGSAGTR